ncbi:hybrid sensor histidine kinase/response regulator [Bosea sp. 2RAB26]|uniref:hybrid sensor histidine kinase/response regulator n=1 Tax=Bosea sp. 2RAB26 TaxID=3237476 RepID=UPI003F8DA604
MRVPALTPDTSSHLRAALVELLYHQSGSILLANLVIPWPVAYVMREVVPVGLLIGWIGATYLLTGARLLLSRRYFARADGEAEATNWARRFTVLSILSSLLWGALGWFGFEPTQPHLIAFVCIVLTGLSGGAVPSLSAYPPAYIGLLIAMHLPFALRCLMQEGSIYSVYALFQLCLIGAYLFCCRVTYRTLKETVALRFENLALVRGLERERDRATAADKAKTRFLAAASHDLRQPVHALALFAATLGTLARRGAVGSHEASGIADKLDAAIGSLGGLLNGLIDVSQLDAGLVPVRRQPAHLGRMLADLQEVFAPQARQRGIDLRAVPGDAWGDSDPELLRRILDNLLSNALRHAPDSRVLIGSRRRGEAIEILVVDTGPGIPQEQHQAVFEEFTQLGNPERDREQGLGLGLAIVRRLGALLEHPIGLRSTAGKGSTFSVRIPRIDPPASGLAPARAQAFPPGLRIMVLDDDPQVLDANVSLLTAWGHEAIAGTDVEELCRRHAKVGAGRVDLIIADYRLKAGLTGSEAVERLAEKLGYRARALIVTGDTMPERLRELNSTGYRVLHKPVAPDALQAAIRQSGSGHAAD